jgi:hypothetical protein
MENKAQYIVLIHKRIHSLKIKRQLLNKWVPAATDTHATVKVLLEYDNGNDVFYVVHTEMLQAGSVEY